MSGRHDVLAALDEARSIGLAELEATASLARRADRKYVVTWSDFGKLVERLATDHRVLEVRGRRAFRYDTVYFDCGALSSFHAHARGERRRFKVRTRHYTDSDLCALELKLKGRRGETVKHRLAYEPEARHELTVAGRAFVDAHLAAAYGTDAPRDLAPTVRTAYARTTLVADGAAERLTCDFDLSYPGRSPAVAALAPTHVIVEAKSPDGRGRAERVLRDLGVRSLACSKYQLGVGLLGLRPVPNDLRRVARRYFVTEPGAEDA